MYSNYCNLAFVSSGPSNRKVGRVIPSFRTAEDEKSPVLSRNTALKENEHPNPRENECVCVCVCVSEWWCREGACVMSVYVYVDTAHRARARAPPILHVDRLPPDGVAPGFVPLQEKNPARMDF